MAQQLHAGRLKIRNITEWAVLLSTPISPATRIPQLSQHPQKILPRPEKMTNKRTFTSFSSLHTPDPKHFNSLAQVPNNNVEP